MATSDLDRQAGDEAAYASGRLTIESIELIPLIVPLDREYRGSYYRMKQPRDASSRASTPTRASSARPTRATRTSTLGEIAAVIRDEIAPQLIGQNAFSYERCWELGVPGHLRPAARPPHRPRRARERRPRDLGRDRQGAGRPLWQLWGGYRDRMPVNIIGGYYGRTSRRIARRGRRLAGDGLPRLQVQGRRPCARARTPRGSARRARPPGDDFVITIDANQGYTLRQALDLCDRVRDLDIRWFEEPCVWTNDRRDMREVRARGGIPVCAGQSEYSPGGLPRPDGGRRDRRLQLRRVVVGRLHELEAHGRVSQLYSVAARPPRGAAGRRCTCSPASRTGPTSRSSTRTAIRSGGT